MKFLLVIGITLNMFYKQQLKTNTMQLGVVEYYKISANFCWFFRKIYIFSFLGFFNKIKLYFISDLMKNHSQGIQLWLEKLFATTVF